MKRLLFLLAFVCFAFTAGLQAQSCHGAKAAKTEGKSCHYSALAAASKAAAQDPSIEVRECAYTGKTTYVRKEVCPHSGRVTYANVEYDAASATFVNIATDAKAEASATVGENPIKKSGPSKVKVSFGADHPACCGGSGSCTKAKAAKAEAAQSAAGKLAAN